MFQLIRIVASSFLSSVIFIFSESADALMNKVKNSINKYFFINYFCNKSALSTILLISDTSHSSLNFDQISNSGLYLIHK